MAYSMIMVTSSSLFLYIWPFKCTCIIYLLWRGSIHEGNDVSSMVMVVEGRMS